MRVHWLAGACVAWLGVAPVDPSRPPDGQVLTWLRDTKGFSDSDIRLLTQGHAVARQLTLAGPEEVSIFGAVRIAAPPGAFIDQLRDIEAYERRLGVLQVGKFHDPPQLADLDALALDRDDLQALRHCRPADCDLQLSAEMMRRFASEVPWRAPDAFAQANRLFREMLFDRFLQVPGRAGSRRSSRTPTAPRRCRPARSSGGCT